MYVGSEENVWDPNRINKDGVEGTWTRDRDREEQAIEALSRMMNSLYLPKEEATSP